MWPQRWVVVGLCVGLLGMPSAEAHLRDYILNQYYYTAKQGEFEVELWNDVIFPEADNDDTYKTKHQLELEYGITDHFQLAYYEVSTWDRAKDWERDQFKIEAKLRLAEAGQWPVDVAFYTEYKNPDGSRDARSDAIENKLILSKDFGPWNVVGNAMVERKINEHDDWEFAYTTGVSYALTARTRLGLEWKETLGDSDEFGLRRKDHKVFVAPGIYHSFTPNVRLLCAPAFGLTRASDDLQLRTILEIEF